MVVPGNSGLVDSVFEVLDSLASGVMARDSQTAQGSLRKANGENGVEVWAYRTRGATQRSEADVSVAQTQDPWDGCQEEAPRNAEVSSRLGLMRSPAKTHLLLIFKNFYRWSLRRQSSQVLTFREVRLALLTHRCCFSGNAVHREGDQSTVPLACGRFGAESN